MALFKGDRKLTLFKGDRRPFAIYKGDKQITGAVKTHLEGTDIVKWESPYKAEIPNVETEGLGKQDKLIGKNLFDKDNLINSIAIEPTENGFNIIDNFATRIMEDVTFEDFLQKIKGKTITTSRDVPYEYDNTATTRLVILGNAVDSIILVEAYHKKKTVNIPQDIDAHNYHGLYAYGKKGEVIKFSNIQIEQGTQATEYEPYCGGIPAPNPSYPIEPRFNSGNKIISRSKNLLPFPYRDGAGFTKYGITFEAKKDGTVSVHGTAIERVFYMYNIDIPMNGKTITVSTNISGKSYIGCGFVVDGSVIWETLFNGDSITHSDVKSIRQIFIDIPKGTVIDEIMEVQTQIELGTQATPYIPYFNGGTADIPILRAIPNTEFKDTYDAQRGIITRRVEELTLTGEEAWSDNWKPKVLTNLQSNRHGININGTTISNYSLNSKIMNGLGSIIGFKDMTEFGCNTADEFKAFLKQKHTEGNPVKIWYALKNPYEEKVSTIPLRQDWNGQLMQTGGDCGYAPMRADVFTEFRD